MREPDSCLGADIEMYDFSVTKGQPAVISTWGPFAMSNAFIEGVYIGDEMALFHTENLGSFRMEDIVVEKREGPGDLYLSPVALAGTQQDSGVFCDDGEQVQVSAYSPPKPCSPLNTIQDPAHFPSMEDIWFAATQTVRTPPPLPCCCLCWCRPMVVRQACIMPHALPCPTVRLFDHPLRDPWVCAVPACSAHGPPEIRAGLLLFVYM